MCELEFGQIAMYNWKRCIASNGETDSGSQQCVKEK